MTKTEVRASVDEIEVRDVGENKRYIEGYALKFDTWSDDLGGFIETISRDALADTDFSDVRALVNHDPTLVLARTTANTLTLSVDDVGLKFRAEVPDTTYGNDVWTNLRAGNINQCSFGFSLDDEGDSFTYDETEGIFRRSLNKIKEIVDVSVVSYPAYRDTDVGIALRSIDKIKNKEHEKEKLRLQIEMM